MKEKTLIKLDLIKIKIFSAKDTKKMKRQATE